MIQHRTYVLVLASLFLIGRAAAQGPGDSVTVSFRYYAPSSPIVHVPGEFNNWANLDPSTTMIYDLSLQCWIKTYVFKIKDPADGRRSLGDSVWQYKFFPEGTTGQWPSDPLNKETNPAENNNSVLRMTNLAWFEFFGKDSSGVLIQIAASLIHSNADSLTSVVFESAPSANEAKRTNDVTGFFDRTRRIISFRPDSLLPKNFFYRLVAYTASGDSTVFQHTGYVVTLAQLPAYAKRGVTLPDVPAGRDSTTIRFQVPGNKNVVLLRIAPLGQPLSGVDPIALRRNFSSEDWWINLMLVPGTYEYLYELEDGRTLYDPWGRQNGTYGTRFTVGPEGLMADNYVWNDAGYQRPEPNKLVIYELNVREAAAKGPSQGTFKDLIPLLAHFNDLGINAIELMPVNDYGLIGASNSFSWGYDLSHHFALEPSYGTPADFKELVDSAHARGIAVLVDVVFNHLNDPAPLWQMLPDAVPNPYFKLPPPSDRRPNEDDLAFFRDMDQWTPEARQYDYEVLKMWLDDYHVDGFRYDFTQGIGWSPNDTSGGILGFTVRIRNEYPDVIQIAEHLPESPALVYYAKLTGGWHDSFRDEVFNDLIPSQKPPLANFESLVLGLGAYRGNDTPTEPASYADRTQPVNATVNHDEQSLIYEMLTFQGVTDTLDALVRDQAYGAMIFTSLGIPMLWQGMEYGESRGWHNNSEKLSYRPVQWNRQYTEYGKWHFQWYKALCYQRRFNPALYNGELKTLYRYDSERTLVWGMEDTVTQSRVMVVANLSESDQTLINVPWLSTGTWYEMISQTPFDVPAVPVATFVIPRYRARIYVNRTNAELNIPVSAERTSASDVPRDFLVSYNYPNPFNPSTSVTYTIPQSTRIRVAVYNIMGEMVSLLQEGLKEPGSYTVSWNGASTGGNPVSSGIYFLRIQTEERTETRKLVLIR